MSDPPAAVADWRGGGRLADVDGRSIFVRDDGAGPGVLILHGFPSSSFDWRKVVPHLATRARVLTFDFLGFGLSEKPPDARYSLFAQADLAEKVAAAAGLSRCTIVAHDMGDTVAAELLRRQVEGRLSFEVAGTILFNGSIFIDLAQLSPGQLALLSLPDEPLPQPLPLEAFTPGLAPTFSREHQPSAEEIEAMAWLVSHGGGDRLLPRLIRYIEERRANQDRWTAGLVETPSPVSAVWGDQDPIAVVEMVERLAELRPSTDVVRWPDVGHWPPIEVPDRTAEEILRRI